MVMLCLAFPLSFIYFWFSCSKFRNGVFSLYYFSLHTLYQIPKVETETNHWASLLRASSCSSSIQSFFPERQCQHWFRWSSTRLSWFIFLPASSFQVLFYPFRTFFIFLLIFKFFNLRIQVWLYILLSVNFQ